MRLMKWVTTATAAAALVACGGGEDVSPGTELDLSGTRGTLLAAPSTIIALTPQEFQQQAPASLFALAGKPKCTVSFNYFQYATVGGAGEKTTASAGMMVPSGTDPACTGERPVVLYAHGTTPYKGKNMALPKDAANPTDSEAALVAALYAAQGYIVVAPNYAGYEASTLPYHPYLNLEQQAQDMIDALTAARKGFATVGAKASSKLFVSGYSQGGFVSMATQRALQLAGTPVTAGAHLSGPYALGQFGDAIFAGNVNLGATLFLPMFHTSMQRTYGNIYSSPADMYDATYVNGIESVLPSTTAFNDLLAQGKLPATALFAADSLPQPAGFELFYGTPSLIKTSYRNALLADAAANLATPKHPLRVAAYKNDLLKQDWTPAQPMLLCGGNADPTVFFALNTQGAQAYFAGKGVPAQAVAVVDVDSATNETDPFWQAKQGFAQAKASTAAAGGATAVAQNYHGGLVPPFCNAAARGYFSQF